MQRNTNLAPKGPYQKIDRTQQKFDRMDELCNIIDREGKISCYQLQNILGFGDFVFYKIMNFVLSEYPEKYKKIKKDIQLKGIYETSTPVTDIEIPPQSKDWEMEL